ncbi:MAG: Trk system potassium transporter TrkA [Spirochaetes bacterium]|jgi:trk system potassium uptake protein TrkA|nr:Trk system potassium transporter TrkA [Spirochaetota bacterium]
MHIIIAGAGAVGIQIAKHLIDEGKDVILIESCSDRAKFVSSTLDCMVIEGSASSVGDLMKAGVVKADFFISVTDSDEINMIASGIVANLFNVGKIITRIRNPEYQNSVIISEKFLNIDYVVNPEIEAAKEIIEITEFGALSHVINFKKSNVRLINMEVEKDSALINKSLHTIRTTIDSGFLVSAIMRNDNLIIPSGETLILENDSIYFQAPDYSIKDVFKKKDYSNTGLKKILVVGGTRIGSRVISRLLANNYTVTLIDKDYNTCKELSDIYTEALIVNADITDENIYEEEKIPGYDLIICLTNNEELNLLTALYAKKVGTKRAIALVVNNNYLKLSRQLGIDSVVSPKSSSVDSILKYIRKGNITSVKSIFNGMAEILEFTLDETNPVIGKKLKNINMPNSSLIISINRKNSKIVPSGDLIFFESDSVLIITKKKSIPKIEKIFTKNES